MLQMLSGNEAIARGFYEAGGSFAAAYPGTPSTEILENIAQYSEIQAQWAPNEKVAAEVTIGASLGGVRALAAMKHVGLNVAADPFFSASYMGVNAGLIFVSADDPSLHSSQNEQDNRWYARAAKVPMLEPADSAEAKQFVIWGLELSEQYDTPVLLRTTTRINHSKTPVALNDRQVVAARNYQRNFQKNVLLPSNARQRHVLVEQRLQQLAQLENSWDFNRLEWRDHEIGIISSGIAYQYARECFSNASFLKLGLTNPLPKRLIQSFAAQVKQLLVIEELDPFLEEQIRAMGLQVIGKEKLPLLYEFNPDIIRDAWPEHFPKTSSRPVEIGTIPQRPPVLCPGCSHRGIFYTLKKLKLNITGDIGCYTLGALPPLNAMDTCLEMGASIGMAHGMEKVAPELKGKLVAVIGDSTFLHSGITGLLDVVYNQSAAKIIILDNHITAMTGHQEHPATGHTLKGNPAPQVDLKQLCQAIGIKRVVPVNPYDLQQVTNVLKTELAHDEPVVIIADAPCIIHARKRFTSPYRVDADKCIACRMCFRVGCPAIEKATSGKTQINSLWCIGCDICRQVCKPGAIQPGQPVSK
ncbi:indolepyruvate ferredoxin oxidoreductase subunit alpha [candidate division KSB1 bacterium]|nr:indolepyruvate ferredoxin oxidoreductase subunit alpha [candidate division KSB1 bacterium]